MKIIRVVAAVIRDGDRIFATARGYGEYKGGWEFPGGKIEPGETTHWGKLLWTVALVFFLMLLSMISR